MHMTNPITKDRWHFEDLRVGQIIELGPTKITKQMILDFAHEFDPLPFHIDEQAAKKSLLGGLAASGWQTAGISLRMLVDNFLSKVDSRGGLGFDNLKWVRPVLANDEIGGQVTIAELRRSNSRPEWAIIGLDFDIKNQRKQRVLTMRLNNLVGVRFSDPQTSVSK